MKRTHTCRDTFAQLILMAVLGAAPGFAQFLSRSHHEDENPLSIENTISAREFAPGSPLQFSPDGKWLSYTLIRSHAPKNVPTVRTDIPWIARGADIHVIHLSTQTDQVVTREKFSNWSPAWSPDSHYLGFLSDRDGSGRAKVWIWDARNDRLTKLSDSPAAPGPLEWMPVGHKIIFSRVMQSSRSVQSIGYGLSTLESANPEVSVYDSLAREDSGPWSLTGYSKCLQLVDVESRKETSIAEGPIGSYQLSPDAQQLAFTVAKRFDKPGSQQILFDLMIVSIDGGGKPRLQLPLLPLESDGSGFAWSPDSTRLCVRTIDEMDGLSAYTVTTVSGTSSTQASMLSFNLRSPSRGMPLWNKSGQEIYFLGRGQLWRYNLVDGAIKSVVQISGREITQVIPGADGMLSGEQTSTLVLTHDDSNKQDGLFSVDLGTGQSVRILETGQCYTCILGEPSVAQSPRDDSVAFVAEDATHAPDLWVGSTRLRSFQQVTRLNQFFNPTRMGKARLIDWLSDDGQRLQGALLLPRDYDPTKRYPLVTYVYGGASLSNDFDRFGFGDTLPLNMQLLATRGYAVFLPDTPQQPGTPMLSLAKTVLPGVNKLIELGIADPERLAVLGHSYGGYSVLSLIVLTNRFKAAIAISGAGDLLSLYSEMAPDGTAYGVGLSEHGQVAMGGTPWDERHRFIENSPFFFYDRIQTPLLIIQGGTDTAVAPFLADQTFVALRRLGKRVEYAKYAPEGHSPAQWSYSDQIDFCSRILQWLGIFLAKSGA